MDELYAYAESHNIPLSSHQQEQFERLAAELVVWNAHTNLTAITEKQDIVRKHFIDSLTVLDALPADAKNIIDIGSGAGFPGMVLKIARPDLDLTLVDATRKKTDFHNHIITTLKLENIRSIHARAEELGKNPRYAGHFDYAVARAVAELATVTAYALPFLKPHGIFIAQKKAGQEEIAGAETALAQLNAKIIATIQLNIPALSPRQLIVIEKLK